MASIYITKSKSFTKQKTETSNGLILEKFVRKVVERIEGKNSNYFQTLQLNHIKYFTAYISERKDSNSLKNQKTYLKALANIEQCGSNHRKIQRN